MGTLSLQDVRIEKIATLQRLIANRTYNVPSARVAAKVIAALLKTESTQT
jgi:anti-sigma28 factor (negative regulator of flagellin synthesis)